MNELKTFDECVDAIAKGGEIGTMAANGAALIAQERRRQIAEEGWTAIHDRPYAAGELVKAAICYAMPAVAFGHDGKKLSRTKQQLWPWSDDWWKPAEPRDESDGAFRRARVRDLTKAGALIAAEIDRLIREGV